MKQVIDLCPACHRPEDRIRADTFTGPAGTFQQLTALTSSLRDLLAKLAIPVPRQILDIQPATR